MKKAVYDDNKISKVQLALIIINTMIGVDVLSLPNTLANKLGADGWIVIIVGGLITALIAAMITKVALKYPDKTLVEYGRELVPVPLANIISIVYLIEALVIGGLVLRIFTDVMQAFLLPETPGKFVAITMCIVAAYMVRSGIESIARLFTVLTIIIMIPVVIVTLIVITDIELSNYLPIFQANFKDIIKATSVSMNSFSGFQFLSIFIFFIKEGRGKVLKYNVLSIGAVIITYLVVFLITIGKFGVTKVEFQLWPTMSLMRSIQIPTALIENADALVMTTWILKVFTTLSSFIFLSSVISNRLLKTKELNTFVIPSIVIMFILSSIPQNLPQNYIYSGAILTKTSIVTAFVVPLLYYVLSKIKDKKEVKCNE